MVVDVVVGALLGTGGRGVVGMGVERRCPPRGRGNTLLLLLVVGVGADWL